MRTVSLLIASFTFLDETLAVEPRVTIPSDLVLKRFSVARGGEALLVPVTLQGEEHVFLLDTGCTHTVFDTSLPLGEPRSKGKLRSPLGETDVWIYNTPDASIGGFPLNAYVLQRPVVSIVGMDLKWIRDITGLPIEGLLGMDFLGRYIIHVNISRGELLFLKSVPKNDRAALPIFWDFGREPEIEAEVKKGQSLRFRIDTGELGDEVGCLETRELSKLIASEDLLEIGRPVAYVLSGSSPGRLSKGKHLIVGDLIVNGPVFYEVLGNNQLGLGFWSKFAVTFDFPGRRLYLYEIERVTRVDRRAN